MGPFWHVPSDSAFEQAKYIALAEAYDKVFCFRIRAALAFLELDRRFPLCFDRTIVDFDDIESFAIARSLSYLKKKLGREETVVRRIRVERLRRIEDRLLKLFDSTIVCSATDRDILASRVPGVNIKVIRNCVRLGEVPARSGSDGVHRVLFVGTMNYKPNIDAVRWFCNHIWGKMRAAASQPSVLSIVGHRPPAEVLALAEIDGVRVVGSVEDVRPYYEESDIVVAPIRFGSGTRIKIVEAMSMAKPVVATTVGAEGLEVVAGRDILIADTEERFAEACVALLNDSSFRMRIGIAARKCIEAKYAEEAAVSELLECLTAPSKPAS
jgi:glycosyltransferase involved in cell wall biosynthesis